jgi:hypothetical protein
MTEKVKPTFAEIENIIDGLPDYPAFETKSEEPLTWLMEWLTTYSRSLDLSRGFLINRCALYWAGYDGQDGFDGQKFVDECQNAKGSVRLLAEQLDTDLQIFELEPQNHGKRNADELALAASYGMMAIEEGTQLFCTCSFGQGVESTAENALKILTSFRPNEESGESSEDPSAALRSARDDDLINLQEFMIKYCGLDHAAMMGAAIACILKGIPMIAEGPSGRLIKTLLEKASGKKFDNIILCNDLNLPINNALPGQKMIMTAILLKTLYTAQDKTDCGKVKIAA